MKRLILSGLILTVGLLTASCSSGGGGESETLNSGLDTTPTEPPPVDPPPVIATAPTIAIDQGIAATSDSLLSLAFNRPGMQEMKISYNNNCDGGTWENYSDAKSLALDVSQLNQTVNVSVTFIDNEFLPTACYPASILHDNIAPVIKIDSSVPKLTNDISQSIAFHAEDSGAGVGQLFCVLPGQQSATPCAGLYNGQLPDGGHVVQLIASDLAGNVSAPTSVSFTVDTTAPVVTLNSVPSALSASTTAKFEFSATDSLSGVSHFECKLDQQSYTSCASGINYTSLGLGSHTVQVRAIDMAGNISSPASYTWTIDNTAPKIRFTQTPASVTNSNSATFAFVGEETDSTPISNFECRLNTGAFSSCSSPFSMSSLSEGKNSFAVRGTSRFGVVSGEIIYSWTIDLTGPTISITKGPALITNSTSANFTYVAGDTLSGVASVNCRVDGGAAYDCSSMVQALTALGGDLQHTFKVIVRDRAGNVTQSAPYLWYIDRTIPLVQIDSTPSAITSQTNAVFQVSGSDDHGSVTYQCRLDGEPVFTNCGTTVNYTSVNDGSHTFSVRSVDSAGNLSVVSTFNWIVDTVGPVIKFTQVPSTTIFTTDQAVLSYTITDPLSTVVSATCTLDSLALTPCSVVNGTFTFPKQAVGAHTFTLTATNAAGLTSTRSYSFTAEPSCTTSLSTTTVPTKMLFIVDMSGSNQDFVGCTLGPNCTDPGKKMRSGSIQTFFNEYGARNNFSWGFDIFAANSSSALINSGLPSSPIFSNAAAMQSAINNFKKMPDDGATPYMAALKLATTLVSNDPDLKSATNAQYIVVFMSDGMPNGYGDTTSNILGQITTMKALAPGRISFNAIYYGPSNKTASDLLEKMATTGNGNFLNTNTSGLSFSISDLVSVPVTTCQ